MAATAHLTALVRERLHALGVTSSRALAALRDGVKVRVSGVVVSRQCPPACAGRPTAKGMAFLALEDEGGLVNVVLKPQVYVTQIKKLPFRHGYGLNDLTLILVEGIVQRNGNAVSVLATRIQPLPTDVSPSVATDQVRASSR